ncbi:hypothetical protein J6590_001849 [Homalodisca vitripennis]|nr:hypothetical protein J6590_001849 [Homalodisca vitripennis]
MGSGHSLNGRTSGTLCFGGNRRDQVRYHLMSGNNSCPRPFTGFIHRAVTTATRITGNRAGGQSQGRVLDVSSAPPEVAAFSEYH